MRKTNFDVAEIAPPIAINLLADEIYLRSNRLFESTPGMDHLQLLVEDFGVDIPFHGDSFSNITCYGIFQPIEKTGGQVLEAVMCSLTPFMSGAITIFKGERLIVKSHMTIRGDLPQTEEDQAMIDRMVVYILRELSNRLDMQYINHRDRELRAM